MTIWYRPLSKYTRIGCYVVTLASSRVWQESHTLTGFGFEAKTIVLPEHAPQKTFPQFRQWCYKKWGQSRDQRLTAGNTNLAPFDSEIADTRVTCFDCFFVYPLVPRQTLVKILKKIMIETSTTQEILRYLHIIVVNFRVFQLGGHVSQCRF